MKDWTLNELMALDVEELSALRRSLTLDLETGAISILERRLMLDTLARIDLVLAEKISRPRFRPGPGGLRPPTP